MTTLANDVQVQLADDVLDSDTSLLIEAAVAPLHNPPEPPAGESAVLTLVDQLAEPTQIEILTYTTVTDNEDGTWTIGGLTRGQEGTSAQAFNSGAWAFQSATVAILLSLRQTTVADLQAINSPVDGQALTFQAGDLVWAGLVLTGITPDEGPDAGTTNVTLSGAGFMDGATATIGGDPVTNLVVDDENTITCTTPSGVVGPADVVVTNPDGKFATLTDGFTYSAPGRDPHWDDVVLLVDASDKGEGTDADFASTVLLVDTSKRT